MEHLVSFRYHIGQEVYFLYKNYPKKGYISNINIRINNMEYDNGWVIEPIVEYRISGKEILWFRENDIWDDKKAFKEWINENLCYTKEIECDKAYAWWFDEDDNNDKSVRILSIIERTNNRHPWKKKKIAEIFYKHNNKGIFRYVLFEDLRDLYGLKSSLTESKNELIKEYGMNYIEDGIYNFVNYDGIKF